jgi:hypothetical protein
MEKSLPLSLKVTSSGLGFESNPQLVGDACRLIFGEDCSRIFPGASGKNLPIGGSESPRYIQLRLEAYNAFNHPNFANPNGNFGAGSPEAAVSETAGPLRLRSGQALHFASVGMTILWDY